MIILKHPDEIQHWALNTKRRGQKIAFVPTMGALHEGHLSLLRGGKRLGDKLVMSLFVNPLQFSPGEDFERYPRDEKRDLEKAHSCGVDVAFIPTAAEMFPNGFETAVAVTKLSRPLCGARRPGHFQGVATVVLKLFNIVQPDVALFGEKDFQQLRVIEQMAADLNLPMTIKRLPTQREKDGLAMSSRNACLSPEERQAALAIPASLQKGRELAAAGETDPKTILNAVVATLTELKKIEIDYVSLCDRETLEELKTFRSPALLAVACFIGKTRLIDNILL